MIDLPKLSSCPWDGAPAGYFSEKQGLRSEPYRVVGVACPKCGVRRAVVLTDAEETAAHSLWMAKSGMTWEGATLVAAAPRAAKLWNERVPA